MPRKWRPWRATKLEMLEFFKRKGIVRVGELVAYFGYTEGAAKNRLYHLKRQKLVTSERRGNWTLTEYGNDRLYELRDRAERALELERAQRNQRF